jgi:hypothetical protein
MANPEHLAILKQGVRAWNSWRREHPSIFPDLADANLLEAELAEAHLFRTNLSRAELSLANLAGARLQGANLYMARLASARLPLADLEGASLRRVNLAHGRLYKANLERTNLSGADCRNADLRRARLVRADVSSARFDAAVMGWTVIASVDLSGALGLDTVNHAGPTYLDIETVYRSNGRIPEAFLRGAGAPDDFIVHIQSLTGKPIEFYSCFISHSSKDEEFARRLYADLQAKSVRCWFSPEHLKIGDIIRSSLDESIRLYDKLLLILSENSINSDWVEKEVETAFERERQDGKTVLFPIRLDDSVMETDKAWASDIRRTRHIGDFRNWREPAAYRMAIERLLRDLKAEPAGK